VLSQLPSPVNNYGIDVGQIARDAKTLDEQERCVTAITGFLTHYSNSFITLLR